MTQTNQVDRDGFTYLLKVFLPSQVIFPPHSSFLLIHLIAKTYTDENPPEHFKRIITLTINKNKMRSIKSLDYFINANFSLATNPPEFISE